MIGADTETGVSPQLPALPLNPKPQPQPLGFFMALSGGGKSSYPEPFALSEVSPAAGVAKRGYETWVPFDCFFALRLGF